MAGFEGPVHQLSNTALAACDLIATNSPTQPLLSHTANLHTKLCAAAAAFFAARPLFLLLLLFEGGLPGQV